MMGMRSRILLDKLSKLIDRIIGSGVRREGFLVGEEVKLERTVCNGHD
jgi:hypothetical protein